MIRKTILGLATVVALTAAATGANAGVKVFLGFPGVGYGPYYGYNGGYYGGYYGCHKVVVGWKKYWNGYHWKKHAIVKKVCY
jgi:hypothetical protein